MVVTDNNCPVRIAENDLRTHINEFIHEEETALKHLLMDEDTTLALGCRNKYHAEKVRRKAWPWSICDIEDRTIKERINHIALLLRNKDIITTTLKIDTQFAESLRNHSKLIVCHVLDGDRTAVHCCQSDEGTDLDHVWKNHMLSAAKLFYTCDCQQVGTNSINLCAHAHQHLAKLLEIWFAGSVIDGCHPLSQGCSHHDIRSTCHRSLVQKHIFSCE